MYGAADLHDRQSRSPIAWEGWQSNTLSNTVSNRISVTNVTCVISIFLDQSSPTLDRYVEQAGDQANGFWRWPIQDAYQTETKRCKLTFPKSSCSGIEIMEINRLQLFSARRLFIAGILSYISFSYITFNYDVSYLLIYSPLHLSQKCLEVSCNLGASGSKFVRKGFEFREWAVYRKAQVHC